MNTVTSFTEKQSGPGSFNPIRRVHNKYLDPSEYSRYSFTQDFLSSAEEIIDSVECLENYHHDIEGESIISILTRSLSSYHDKGKELKLVKYILETGIEEVAGTAIFIYHPHINVPIRQSWIDETFGNDMLELEQFIKAGLIQQHLSMEAINIREILQGGLINYISQTVFEYDTVETLIKHLLGLYDTVYEDELEEEELYLYRDNFYNKLLETSVDYDKYLVNRLEIILQYHKMGSHPSLTTFMEKKYSDTDNAHNVIHRYLKLWPKEDTTQKGI